LVHYSGWEASMLMQFFLPAYQVCLAWGVVPVLPTKSSWDLLRYLTTRQVVNFSASHLLGCSQELRWVKEVCRQNWILAPLQGFHDQHRKSAPSLSTQSRVGLHFYCAVLLGWFYPSWWHIRWTELMCLITDEPTCQLPMITPKFHNETPVWAKYGAIWCCLPPSLNAKKRVCRKKTWVEVSQWALPKMVMDSFQSEKSSIPRLAYEKFGC
jgi:hypothetical protein